MTYEEFIEALGLVKSELSKTLYEFYIECKHEAAHSS